MKKFGLEKEERRRVQEKKPEKKHRKKIFKNHTRSRKKL
jgi:hypothetical protein